MPVDEELFEIAINHKSFKNIRELYQKHGNFSGIKPREFKHICEEIYQTINLIIDSIQDDTEKKKFEENTICNYQIRPVHLRNILDREYTIENKTDKRYLRSIRTLKEFLLYTNRPVKNQTLNALGLVGFWYVYRYDNEFKNVKRTILHIESQENIHFTSMLNKFENGILKQLGSLITITFVLENIKSIEISISIRETTGNKPKVFNGILRSIIHEAPIAKQCVLVKADQPVLDTRLHEVFTIYHTSNIQRIEKNSGERIASTLGENSVIEYLSRQPKPIIANPFIPPTTQHIIERNERSKKSLKKFTGKYIAFIPYAYEKGKALSLIQLEIDGLGRTQETVLLAEKVKASDTHKKLQYHGQAVIVKDTLRLSNTNKLHQKSEYLFTINSSAINSEVLQGITLDTDNEGFPCADACIAIRYTRSLGFPFKAMIVRKSTPIYNKLNVLLKTKLAASIDRYFFELYPSIRHK